MKERQTEPIAIIGIGCRFPGAKNLPAFWKLLKEGIDAVREVPENRWDISQLYDQDSTKSGKMSSRWGGFIDHIDQFDWRAFRLLPREVKYMDPQHRLLLEVVWEALEDAGLPLEKIAGSRTSVFQGISSNDYLRLQSRSWSQLDSYTLTGNDPTFTANRISYFFDLKGPSVTITQGCASSLVALHYACQSLWTGEATLAIAGGVNLMLSPDINIMLSKTGTLSPEGRCKTLDSQADGFVRGEGAGSVVLKPLSQVNQSDRIYALIRGSAINHNGHNEWIMAANPESQESVIREACRRANVELSNIDYVELHGTALPKGDPIEAKVLGATIGTQSERTHPCFIGSVKTNIGHLEAASGIASLIKVALSLYYREIPPTLHLQQTHPDIPLESLGLVAPKKLETWPNKVLPDLAGVTAISMAGVNAHMILEGSPQSHKGASAIKRSEPKQVYLLPLSARSPEALVDLADTLRNFLLNEDTKDFSFLDICYTASVRRSHHEYRLAVTGDSRESIAKLLASFLKQEASPALFWTTKRRTSLPKIILVLPDQVPQGWTISKELLEQGSLFRTVLAECDRLFCQHANWSLLTNKDTGKFGSDCLPIETTQLELFALQIALATQWRSWGIAPHVFIGDGLAKITAAHLAGTLSLEDAVISLVSNLKSFVPQNQHQEQKTESGKLSFCEALLEQMVTNSYNVFLELAPEPVLSEAISKSLCQTDKEGILLGSWHEGEAGQKVMLESLSFLYSLGCQVKWDALYGHECRCVQLPTYPWQRERLWLDWLDVKTVSTAPEIVNRFQGVENEKRSSNGTIDRPLQAILGVESDQRQYLLESYLIEQIASTLECNLDDLNTQLPLNQLGLDSISALEIKHRLEFQLGVAIPVTKLLEGWTVSEFVFQELIPQLANEITTTSSLISSAQENETWEEFEI